MSKSTWAGAALSAILAVLAVSPASAQDHKARAWASGCAACHGTNGRSVGDVPAIAGRSKADLYAVLKEFKEGKRRTATVMHQHAKGYTDAQLERIAEYFSQQPR